MGNKTYGIPIAFGEPAQAKVTSVRFDKDGTMKATHKVTAENINDMKDKVEEALEDGWYTDEFEQIYDELTEALGEAQYNYEINYSDDSRLGWALDTFQEYIERKSGVPVQMFSGQNKNWIKDHIAPDTIAVSVYADQDDEGIFPTWEVITKE